MKYTVSNKKIINIATEEYVNELIENIELTEGKSAYQVAVENGFVGTEEEWVKSLKGNQGEKGEAFKYEDFTEEQLQNLTGPKGEDGKFDMEMLYDILETEDKTVIGAINELFKMIKDWMDPVYDIKSQMFYGVIDPTTSGVITTYADVTIDMLNNASGIKSTKPGERLALSIGYVDEGSYIIVAIPALYDFTVTKDDGFGGKIEFDESIIGANGIDVEFDETDYRLYGEFVLVGGHRTIYIEEPEKPVGGECGCGCVDLTTEDIADVMSDVFNPEE